MKKINPLKPAYGKLRVVSEELLYGRRMVKVQCTCGTLKEVYADALRSGRTQSCGASTCRPYNTTRMEKRGYTPRGPRDMTLPALNRYWNLYERGMPVTDIAKNHAENRSSLYSSFAAIRKCGGWPEYAKRVAESE